MSNYRAVMLTQKGGPEVLRVVTLPLVDPGPGEALVAVSATGAGGTDITMRRGRYLYAPPIPFVPGYEIVGRVEAIGPGVTEVAVGQRVAALVGHGGYAEKIVLQARELVPVPEGLDDGEVAALILNYVTAYQAIHRVGAVKAGQTALVTGANGGVGTAVVELLKVAGVRVFAAASPTHHAMLRDLGATPIDGRGARVDESIRALLPGGVDIAFDGLGGRFVAQCVRATRRGGTIVGYGFSSTMMNGTPSRLATLRGMLALFVLATITGRRGRFYGITHLYRRDPRPFREDLTALFALLASRTIAPRIAARLPLLAAREANEMLERGGVQGKIVNVVNVGGA